MNDYEQTLIYINQALYELTQMKTIDDDDAAKEAYVFLCEAKLALRGY